MKRTWTSDIPNLTIGMDLHDTFSDLCLLDAEARVQGRERVRTTRAHLTERFRVLPPARVVLEVGTHSPWVSRLLRDLGHEVIIANPSKIRRHHGQRPRKSNRIDAEYLARQGRADPALLYPLEHRGEEAQQDLALIRARDALVRARTQLVNHVRGAVKATGHRLPRSSTEAFARSARTHLPAELRPALEGVLAAIDALTQQIRASDAQVEERCEGPYARETSRLRQVAGVGALTALTYVLVLEEAARFPRSRSVGAYVGLCSRLDESGEEHVELGITRAGDPLLRRLLVGSAHYILGPFGPDCDLRRSGLRLIERGGRGAKKRAVVAVARKLAVLLHRLWVSGQPYEPLRHARRRERRRETEAVA